MAIVMACSYEVPHLLVSITWILTHTKRVLDQLSYFLEAVPIQVILILLWVCRVLKYESSIISLIFSTYILVKKLATTII